MLQRYHINSAYKIKRADLSFPKSQRLSFNTLSRKIFYCLSLPGAGGMRKGFCDELPRTANKTLRYNKTSTNPWFQYFGYKILTHIDKPTPPVPSARWLPGTP